MGLFVTSKNGSSSKIYISQLDSICDNSLQDVNKLVGNVYKFMLVIKYYLNNVLQTFFHIVLDIFGIIVLIRVRELTVMDERYYIHNT